MDCEGFTLQRDGTGAASAAELEYHIVFAADVHAIENAEAIKLQASTTIVRKMLHNLIASLKQP